MPEDIKRNIAYKIRIGELIGGKPLIEMDRLKHLEVDGKQIVRVNVIANITDKYIQDGEKKFASLTLDDATGQIKVKAFGEDIKQFEAHTQGDTVLIIGLVRSWNNEVYITPEIIKKKEPAYLMVRKLEAEKQRPQKIDKTSVVEVRGELLKKVKEEDERGGVEIEKLMLELKATPDTINNEVRKLLEEGIVYEPRPGKLRYLG
jgi:RPA family protein